MEDRSVKAMNIVQYLRSEAVVDQVIRDVESVQVEFSESDEKKIALLERKFAEDDEFYNSDCGESDEDELDGGKAKFSISPETEQKHLSVLLKVKELLDLHDSRYPLPNERKHKALVMIGTRSKVVHHMEKICNSHSLLKELNPKAYYSGKNLDGKELRKSNRERIMRKFKRAPDEKEEGTDPRVLFVTGMLREGFDFNSVSVVGISRNLDKDGPTFEQFVGRAVRTYRADEPAGLTAKFVWHSFDDFEDVFDKYKQDRKIVIQPF